MRGRKPLCIDRFIFPFLVIHAIFPVMWLTAVARNGPVRNDWFHLKIVASHFVAGNWTYLYSIDGHALNPGYFWRYPPFALYLIAPLAWLPDTEAYALLALVEAAALMASVWLLWELEPFGPMRREWLLAIVLSAPALSTVITGQSSALIMLCVVTGASLWTRRHLVLACAVLGLLAIKPNWGAVFGLMAVVRGEWKGAAAMAGVGLLLCLAALPLGLQIWIDFLRTSLANADVLLNYEPQKLITLKGFLEGMFGKSQLTQVAWTVMVLGLIATAICAWRAPGSPLRHLGVALLLAVAANPYASFYDALVLAVPATVWWAERHQWRRRPWLIVAMMLAFAWCGEQWMYSWGAVLRAGGFHWFPRVSLVGPATAVWLILAAQQAMQSIPVASTERP